MVTCEEITELITEYLEGGLSFWRRMSFHLHVGICGKCRRYLKQIKTTIRLTGEVPIEPVPDDVCDEMLRQFRAWSADE